jgi:hypothetical protein
MRRLRRGLAVALAQCAAMALAIGVPIALQFSATESADAAYLTALNLSSRDSVATVELEGAATPDRYQSLQGGAANAVIVQTGGRLTEIAEYATTSSFRVVNVNGGPYPLEDLPPLTAMLYPALEAKAQLVAGVWPASGQAGPIQVSVSDASAQLYSWKVGDVVCVASVNDRTARPTSQCLHVTGFWHQPASSDPFWLAEPPITALTFAADGYWLFARTVQEAHSTASRVYRPDPTRLTVAEAPALETGIRRLRHSLRFAGDDLLTSLDLSIAAFLDRANVNRLPVQLVGAELIFVVLFGLGFMTQSFLASQTAQCALWRVRGWSRFDVARYLGAQQLFLAVPAAVLGVAAAIATTLWEARGYHLNPGVVTAGVGSMLATALTLSALAVAAVCAAMTLRFSWRTIGNMRRAAGSPTTSTWWRSRGIDLVLGLMAVPLLAEAALRGEATVRSSSSGVDGIGLALPILALTFLAIAALRLIPIFVQPLRFLGSSIAARLTWWRLGRRPAEHAGIAVLLSLTLALGLFASIYETTETSNAEDRASYAAGADLRIAFTPEAGVDGIRNQIAEIDGVKAATPVLRTQLRIASSPDAVVALGLDPATYAAAAWSRPGLTSPALGAALAQMSGVPSSIELQGQPNQLRLWVDGLGQPASLEAVVRDGAGQVCHCSFGSLQYSDWRQLQAQVAFSGSPQYPLSLERLTIHRAGIGRPAAIAIASLQSVSGSTGANIDDFATVRGWWTRDSAGFITAPGSGGPQRGGAATTDIALPPTGDLNLYPPYRGALPFLVSEATMSRLALRPGDYVPLEIQSHELNGEVIGAVDYVPTLYPGYVDFIVVPLNRAISAFASSLGESQMPGEVWLALTPRGALAAQGIGPSSNINFAVNRMHEQHVATNDPILIQLRANLATAFFAALLLAFLAFVVHFVVASRRRLAEHAILEANGLEPDDVRRGIAIEQLVIVGFAVLVGAALAAVAVAVLLPSLQFGTGPDAIEPPTVVRIDWSSLLLGLAATAAITAVAAWLTRGLGAKVNVVEEVRRLG